MTSMLLLCCILQRFPHLLFDRLDEEEDNSLQDSNNGKRNKYRPFVLNTPAANQGVELEEDYDK